ncbi:hypothetical protein [Methylobacterium gregans]|uniref:Uncharacterized protein n=1 Tax=Methylobacterium gregans TaxID=374424 RepID=A0AA37HNI8_9HYPH|nr:hypothetical protein [Methylobacterium gregans]MDQ0522091.1 hypothetical protein [Methylobacterium gregans]GJD78621.1 hypothetical protein NBEOAGPD_1838 [Methylobacterium gregans]GLS51871.1 hypothetical protein GCM10007886_00530 [Methylobacterium gregans]
MTNFLLGAVAGALFACVGTIAAVRQPEIQTRLGLRPAVMLAAAPVPAPRAEVACPPAADAKKVGTVEMLLSPRRFWWIAP